MYMNFGHFYYSYLVYSNFLYLDILSFYKFILLCEKLISQRTFLFLHIGKGERGNINLPLFDTIRPFLVPPTFPVILDIFANNLEKIDNFGSKTAKIALNCRLPFCPSPSPRSVHPLGVTTLPMYASL